MSDPKTANIQRWFGEVWNAKKPEVVRELLAADAVMHGITHTGADVKGPDEFLKLHSELVTAFPDIQFQLHECFGSGDYACIRWTATMRHTVPGLGIAPTNAPVQIGGIGIARFQNGKVVETWDNWDRLAMFQQIDAATKAMSA
jgi:predicted ester cyclase